MEELKLTIPEGVDNVKAELDYNEETGNYRIIIHGLNARIQYVGKITTQEKLDYIVDTLLYVESF